MNYAFTYIESICRILLAISFTQRLYETNLCRQCTNFDQSASKSSVLRIIRQLALTNCTERARTYGMCGKPDYLLFLRLNRERTLVTSLYDLAQRMGKFGECVCGY